MVNDPSMRDEVIGILKTLSDIEYQRQAWVNHNFPEGIEFDCFDISIDLLLEDLQLIELPENTLGGVFENQEEIDAVREVALAMDRVLKIYGTKLSDGEYISTPEWEDVLNTSANALAVIQKYQP
jgi:hypothetical protein